MFLTEQDMRFMKKSLTRYWWLDEIIWFSGGIAFIAAAMGIIGLTLFVAIKYTYVFFLIAVFSPLAFACGRMFRQWWYDEF